MVKRIATWQQKVALFFATNLQLALTAPAAQDMEQSSQMKMYSSFLQKKMMDALAPQMEAPYKEFPGELSRAVPQIGGESTAQVFMSYDDVQAYMGD